MARLAFVAVIAAILGGGATLIARGILVRWSSPPPIVVTAVADGAARVWQGHNAPVTSVGYLDSAEFVTTASLDGELRNWYWDTVELLASCNAGVPIVRKLAYVRDGQTYMTLSNDSIMRNWAHDGSALRRTPLREVAPNSIGRSAGDPMLVVGGLNGATIYDDGREEAPPKTVIDGTAVTAIGVSGNGRDFVVATAGGKLTRFEFHTGFQKWELQCGADVSSIAMAETSSGERMLTADARGLHLWDCAKREVIRDWVGHGGSVGAVAAFRNGAGFVTISDADDAIRVWDCESAAPLAELVGVLHVPTAVTASADGKRIVAGDALGHIVLWDWQKSKAAGGTGHPARE